MTITSAPASCSAKAGSPLAGTACIAGRGDAVAGERENVLLALDDEQPLFQRQRLDRARAGGTSTCRTPLTLHTQPSFTLFGGSSGRARRRWRKDFRLEAADLEQQRAGFVGVVVGRDDLEPSFARSSSGVAVIRARLSHCTDLPHALALEEIDAPRRLRSASWSNQVPLATSTLRAPLVPQRSSFLLEWRRIRLAPEMPGHIGHDLGELGDGHDASRTGSPRFHASHCASASAERRSPWSHPWSRASTSQPPSAASLIKIAAALRAGNRTMCALTTGSST